MKVSLSLYRRCRSVGGRLYRALWWHFLPYARRRALWPLQRVRYTPDDSLAITVLTYKRPRELERTLETFYERNAPYVRALPVTVLVQGNAPAETIAAQQVIRAVTEKYHVACHVIVPGTNLGIGAGYTMLMEHAMRTDPAFILHIEDDWESQDPLTDHLAACLALFRERTPVGSVRLKDVGFRLIRDHAECNGMRFRTSLYRSRVSETSFFWIGNLEFGFPPSITRADIIRKMLPIRSERDARRKYQLMGWYTAQLHASCFSHQTDHRVEGWKR